MNLFKKKQKKEMNLQQKMAEVFAKELASQIFNRTEIKTDDQQPVGTTEIVVSDTGTTKRKYVRSGKYSKKPVSDKGPDALKPFRDRAAANGTITPEQVRDYGRVGDVYYIPYKEGEDLGAQQANYTGRLTQLFKTQVSTIYGVNSRTKKAENLMRLELFAK